MNIFVVDEDPLVAASQLCDKHVVKMPLESAQMLCTALNVQAGGVHVAPYKTVHRNHPATIWARTSQCNFMWLCEHGLALCKEYTARYGRVHRAQSVIEWCKSHGLPGVGSGLTKHPLCMPDRYKQESVVASYRHYYMVEKWPFASWKRNKPDWWHHVQNNGPRLHYGTTPTTRSMDVAEATAGEQELVVVLTSNGWHDPKKYVINHKDRQNRSIPEKWVQWIVNSKGEVAVFGKDNLDPRLTGQAFTDDSSKWIHVPFFDEVEDAVDYLWDNRSSPHKFGAQVLAKHAYMVITEQPVIAAEIEMPLGGENK